MNVVLRNSTPSLPFTFRTRNIFDSLFSDDFFTSNWRLPISHKANPDVKIETTDASYSINIAAPGLPKDAVSVEVKGDVLTVSSEINEEKESSHFCSSFKKSWTLPEDVDVEKIDASYNNGVFVVSVPRAEPIEPTVKKIKIK